jgi:hypothetical protein
MPLGMDEAEPFPGGSDVAGPAPKGLGEAEPACKGSGETEPTPLGSSEARATLWGRTKPWSHIARLGVLMMVTISSFSLNTLILVPDNYIF